MQKLGLNDRKGANKEYTIALELLKKYQLRKNANPTLLYYDENFNCKYLDFPKADIHLRLGNKEKAIAILKKLKGLKQAKQYLIKIENNEEIEKIYFQKTNT